MQLTKSQNNSYSKIGLNPNPKEALELTTLKNNPLICKNFTFKSIDKTGFTGKMANDSMSPIINESDVFTASFFTNPKDYVEGGLYVVYLKDDFSIYVTVKKVFRGGIGELILKSNNKDYYKDICVKSRPEEIIIAKLTSLFRIF